MGIRKWKLPSNNIEIVKNLMEQTGKSEIVCSVFAARGITDPAEVLSFLDENTSMSDPFKIIDMDKAAQRITEAVENGEQICVYGDYDCDGISATALLTSYLQSIGAAVIYYIPSRDGTGYGMHKSAVDMLSEQNIDLIITVDNGISAYDEIEYANQLGIDVVVTDHHTPPEKLPNAVAIVDPHRSDCPSGLTELAGVGVAFKLICAMEDAHGEELLEYYSQLVMLGTIADVVSLTGENRIIVRHGLSHIQESESPGITALLQVSALKGKMLTSESVAFGLAPRINAAGRVGTADDVVELLLTDDVSYATELAELLNEQNTKRRAIEADILQQAERMLAQNPQMLKDRVLIIAGKNWHHGVIGIVSSKLMERYQKPCILLSIDNGVAQGSGRSFVGFSIIEAITACSRHLTRFGGHIQAVGLTLPLSELEAFKLDMQTFAKEKYPVMPVPELVADCILQPEKMNLATIGQLSELEPFGAGNWSPTFYMKNIIIQAINPTADGKHIKLRMSGSGNTFFAIYFNMSADIFPYKVGESVEMITSISIGEYNGSPNLSIRISDLRLPDLPQEQILLEADYYASFQRGEQLNPDAVEVVLPNRDNVGLVYKYLRRAVTFKQGESALYLRLMNHNIGYGQVLIALDVLEEMGFIKRSIENGVDTFSIIENAPRADLANSEILKQLEQWKTETLVKV